MEAILNAAFGVWGYSAWFLQHPTWGTVAIAASVTSLSVGATVLVAVASLFLPVTVVLVAATATLAPTTAALGWVMACTGPACAQLWRPMVVWIGTRSGLLRNLLLLPVDEGGHGEGGEGGVEEEKLSGGVLWGKEAVVSEWTPYGEGPGEEPVSLAV